eukprot:09179.XXX_381433_381642_1 [CDS] Oithona nana genome sequencing.
MATLMLVALESSFFNCWICIFRLWIMTSADFLVCFKRMNLFNDSSFSLLKWSLINFSVSNWYLTLLCSA